MLDGMSLFHVVEHTVRCQHIRERPAGVELGRDNELRMHVKQYIPKSNPRPRPGDVTIIGAHANGFPKELYEPFWDDLAEQMQSGRHKIRGIWIADIASQGQSGIMNESLLGSDASWFDHGRDLLHLINQFQDDMPAPLIGIGHSVGTAHLTHMSLFHPRLLYSMILVEPTIQRDVSMHRVMAQASTIRRDVWPSRRDAAAKFAASRFYQQWDERVLEKWIEYGLRDLPTEQYPDPSQFSQGPEIPVTLSTTKAQEVGFYLRANYSESRLLQGDIDLQYDIHPEDRGTEPFARPESQYLFRRLPEVKPSVLYIFGQNSPVSPPESRHSKVETTGTGVGGSGGAAESRVKDVLFDCGHLALMEMPKQCAAASATFIDSELDRWDHEARNKREIWNRLSRAQRTEISEKWKQHMGVPSKRDSADGDKKGAKI